MSGGGVLYINYDPGLADMREQVLSRLGYEVVSVVGSTAARRMARTRVFDLVVVGHSAPEEERRGMAHWLKENLPGIPVLALCPAPFQGVDYGDYQADAHNPDAWVRLVQEVLSKKGV